MRNLGPGASRALSLYAYANRWAHNHFVSRLRQSPWVIALIAVGAPCALAGALVPLRNRVDNANVALLLAALVVVIAARGMRVAAAISAASAMVWFDFFHTKPYQSFTINSHDDVVTAVLLLAVGLFVGEIAYRARGHRQAAVEGSAQIGRIHGVAELVAAGESAEMLVIVVAGELRELLSLQDVRFENGGHFVDPRPVARVERSGLVTFGSLTWSVDRIGFPSDTVTLEVHGAGRMFGRYVLVRTAGAAIPFDRRIVAVALADQVGAAFAAKMQEEGSRG